MKAKDLIKILERDPEATVFFYSEQLDPTIKGVDDTRKELEELEVDDSIEGIIDLNIPDCVMDDMAKEELIDDLVGLCEDNEVMAECIRNYFKETA